MNPHRAMKIAESRVPLHEDVEFYSTTTLRCAKCGAGFGAYQIEKARGLADAIAKAIRLANAHVDDCGVEG